jgi:uncharacterized protein YdeI (YjbR/CyaY-like superfamily)
MSNEPEFQSQRVAVKAAIDSHTVRGSLMPQGDGTYIFVVNKEIRTAIGKEAGDSVRVCLEPDTTPRTVELPAEFQRALKKHKSAWANFQRLSYSHRKEYVQWIEAAKKAETKQRRILKAVEKLATGEPRG